jgi:hypothetical protein
MATTKGHMKQVYQNTRSVRISSRMTMGNLDNQLIKQQ